MKKISILGNEGSNLVYITDIGTGFFLVKN